jgi:hypothetical protein
MSKLIGRHGLLVALLVATAFAGVVRDAAADIPPR